MLKWEQNTVGKLLELFTNRQQKRNDARKTRLTSQQKWLNSTKRFAVPKLYSDTPQWVRPNRHLPNIQNFFYRHSIDRLRMRVHPKSLKISKHWYLEAVARQNFCRRRSDFSKFCQLVKANIHENTEYWSSQLETQTAFPWFSIIQKTCKLQFTRKKLEIFATATKRYTTTTIKDEKDQITQWV